MGLFKNKNKGDMTILTSQKDAIKKIGLYLENSEMKTKYDDETNTYYVGSMGDDLPIITMVIIQEQIISFRCPLHLQASPNNFQKVLAALNEINSKMLLGAFYLDVDDEESHILYEYGFPYTDTRLSEEFFLAVLRRIFSTVDAFDGDLKKIAEEIPRSKYESMYEPMYQ